MTGTGSEQEKVIHFDKHKPASSYEGLFNRLGVRGSLLDIGCGNGEWLEYCKGRGIKVYGVEVLEDFCSQVLKKGIECRTSIDGINNTFDFITMNSVIQYVDDVDGFLSKVSSLLNKNGTVYIETQNDNSLIYAVIKAFKGHIVRPHWLPYQRSAHTKTSLKSALTKAGLKPVKTWTYGFTKGGNPKNLKLAYRSLIALGALIGRGHLLFCIAQKP